MAAYDYKCESCGHAQEHRHGMKEDGPPCPKCQSKAYKKQISAGTTFQLKGSGWYQTDFRNKR